MRMTQDYWDQMTDRQQLEYLESHDIRIQKQRFLNTKKKVGDYDAFCTKYRAHVDGLMLSGWEDSSQKARSVADAIIDHIRQVNDYNKKVEAINNGEVGYEQR